MLEECLGSAQNNATFLRTSSRIPHVIVFRFFINFLIVVFAGCLSAVICDSRRSLINYRHFLMRKLCHKTFHCPHVSCVYSRNFFHVRNFQNSPVNHPRKCRIFGSVCFPVLHDTHTQCSGNWLFVCSKQIVLSMCYHMATKIYE